MTSSRVSASAPGRGGHRKASPPAHSQCPPTSVYQNCRLSGTARKCRGKPSGSPLHVASPREKEAWWSSSGWTACSAPRPLFGEGGPRPGPRMARRAIRRRVSCGRRHVSECVSACCPCGPTPMCGAGGAWARAVQGVGGRWLSPGNEWNPKRGTAPWTFKTHDRNTQIHRNHQKITTKKNTLQILSGAFPG